MKQAVLKLQLVRHRGGTRPATDIAARVREHFEELRAPVYAYARTIVHRPEVAEDLTQETFLRLYSHLSEGNDVDSVKAWAFRVCHNLAMNHLKKNPRDVVHEYGRTNGDGRSGSGDQMVAVEPDPERRLLEKERYQRLGQSIGQLTEHQKRCLYLRAEGFRYREIAEQLNITISSVVDTLTRAVERLRKA